MPAEFPLDDLAAAFRTGAAYLRTGRLAADAFAGVTPVSAVVTRWLSEADDTELHALGVPRETALRHARAGDASGAAAWMDQARNALDAARLSPPGRLMAESLHHAAQAYLDYRAARWSAARAHLDAALACANETGDAHGFPAVEARRIHLGHVILRTEMARGADPRGALETAARLWAYAQGDADAWPFAPLRRPARPAPPRLATLTLNEVVTEVALLLAREPAHTDRALRALAPYRLPPADGPDPFDYARAWLRAKHAAHNDPPDAFFAAAAPFLAKLDGPRPLLWYAVLHEVHARLANQPGHPAVELRREMERDHPPHPGLPPFLRLVRAEARAGPAQPR